MQNKNVKAAKIAVVLTDPDDWTASTFLKNIRKRDANALPVALSTLNASITSSDSAILDTDSKALNLGAILVRNVGISFSHEQISLVLYGHNVPLHFYTKPKIYKYVKVINKYGNSKEETDRTADILLS